MSSKSSPRTMDSPPSLAPKVPLPQTSVPVSMKSVAPRSDDAKPVTQIVTSKEWVLPPRPKPGRKPSVDTPASKRKAQNRAAQRAFRERRATRVQELEQKLLEVEKEKEVKEMNLLSSINLLKGENSGLLKSMESMKRDIAMLKQSMSRSGSQAGSPPGYTLSAAPSPLTVTSSSYQQISPAPSADSPQIYDTLSKYPSAARKVSFDCGVCIRDECICANVGIKTPSGPSLDAPVPAPGSERASGPSPHEHHSPHQPLVLLEQTLRTQLESFKPEPAVLLGRKRSRQQSEAFEIDFTRQFSQKPMPDMNKLKSRKSSQFGMEVHGVSTFNKDSPVDSCGFCTDDTPCVCREAAEEAARLSRDSNALPPLNTQSVHKASLPVLHPGPTLEIANFQNLTPGAVPLVVNPTTRNPVENTGKGIAKTDEEKDKDGCTGDPGTCRQCQMDPLSTLFCSTVASKAKDSTAKAPPPLLPSTPTNRIMTPTAAAPCTPAPSTPGNIANAPQGLYIPCADAYKTLSRHKHFNQVDFTTLVGKLTTRGMQVEVQSVANVLRELDRNLYK